MSERTLALLAPALHGFPHLFAFRVLIVSTGLKRPHFHRVCCWEEEAIGKDAVRTL
jgi:hypothetical protein